MQKSSKDLMMCTETVLVASCGPKPSLSPHKDKNAFIELHGENSLSAFNLSYRS